MCGHTTAATFIARNSKSTSFQLRQTLKKKRRTYRATQINVRAAGASQSTRRATPKTALNKRFKVRDRWCTPKQLHYSLPNNCSISRVLQHPKRKTCPRKSKKKKLLYQTPVTQNLLSQEPSSKILKACLYQEMQNRHRTPQNNPYPLALIKAKLIQ